jgi:hypothetical protein
MVVIWFLRLNLIGFCLKESFVLDFMKNTKIRWNLFLEYFSFQNLHFLDRTFFKIW